MISQPVSFPWEVTASCPENVQEKNKEEIQEATASLANAKGTSVDSAAVLF